MQERPPAGAATRFPPVRFPVPLATGIPLGPLLIRHAADGLRREDGQTPMVTTASVFGLLSAGIFLAHALEAYRSIDPPNDADLGSSGS
jgi:hypothetical protein